MRVTGLHRGEVLCCNVIGPFVLTAGFDKFVHIWDPACILKRDEEIRSLPITSLIGHEHQVRKANFPILQINSNIPNAYLLPLDRSFKNPYFS